MTSPPLPLLTGAKESAPPVLSMPPIAACGKVNNFAQMQFSIWLSETMAKQYTGTFGAMAKATRFVEK